MYQNATRCILKMIHFVCNKKVFLSESGNVKRILSRLSDF
ncbi:Protein CBG26584 [Caenorhabditis briggsae]|uniref:Protein CBG26584 n=1 Tax=Caenorhabditis briggsae TaxID=6238 RepID=B6IIE4_CAEBR|nr:Protein CBG26584 [Caenorhabditis briggsae]CAR99674.1 Protein CBG26584 [Caenorhabditis briggsae]